MANHLGLDASCLGNHEFDYGWEKIESFMRAGRFPTVAANVVNASGGRLLPDPYVLRNVGGVRVAIVGALLEAAGPWGPWRSAPIVETLRPVVAEAKTRSDLVIVLGHLERTEIQRVLQELPDVAVVVAGHNHGGMDPIEMNGRIAVHASGYGREVGRLRLQYDVDADRIISHAWNGIPVNSSLYPADASTKRDVDGWEAKVAAIVDVPVGRASRRMGRDEIRERIQSVLLERYKADIAFISRGEIRDIIPEGDLLARHLWNVSPYEDRVVLVEISGRRLVELLNPEQPPASGTGIGSIDSTRQYRVVTIDFFAKQWTQEDGNARFADQNTLLRDVFIDWVKSRGTIP